MIHEATIWLAPKRLRSLAGYRRIELFVVRRGAMLRRLARLRLSSSIHCAQYFPQISLTADAGFQSSALNSLFTGPAGLWSMAGSFTQPIFQGGRLKNNVRLTESQKEQLLLTYQQTIQGAFRDVSNALVGYRKTREFRI
jgi:multidrug efflux system outer membrane protein